MANEMGAGYHTRCGIGLESLAADYDATRLVAPTILMPFVNENLDKVVEYLENNVLAGKRGYEAPHVIGYKTSGPLRVRAHHRLAEFLWFAALGGTDTKSGASAPYTHQLDKGEDILRTLSIIIDKDPDGGDVIKCWNIIGAVINKLTLTSSVKEGTYLDIELVCFDITRTTDHRAALAALSFVEQSAELFHDQLVLRMADCEDALGDSDKQRISDYSLSIDNKLLSDDQDSVSGLYIDRPRPNGKAEISLSFSIPRYYADTLINAKDDGTMMQADIVHTGGALGAGNYKTEILLPTVYIKSLPAPASGEEKISLSGMAQCYKNNGNTNMATITEEIQVKLYNGNDTELAWTA